MYCAVHAAAPTNLLPHHNRFTTTLPAHQCYATTDRAEGRTIGQQPATGGSTQQSGGVEKEKSAALLGVMPWPCCRPRAAMAGSAGVAARVRETRGAGEQQSWPPGTLLLGCQPWLCAKTERSWLGLPQSGVEKERRNTGRVCVPTATTMCHMATKAI